MAAPEILIIEDRKDDRDLFTAAVFASGLHATVTHASDATEAVVRLNRLGGYAGKPLPALVVLDLGLPGLKGKTLLQVIRTAYGPREVPLVVLTGSRRPDDKTICASWGIDEFMVKPQDFAELVRWVRSLERFLPSSDESGDERRRVMGVADDAEGRVVEGR